MNQASAHTAETIEFPTFDAAKTTDQFRVFAEHSAEQSKQAYAKFKSGAETAQKAIESTFETAREASTELSLKSLAAARANAEAGFAHLEALFGARTFSEVIELQTSFVRKAAEQAAVQAKEFQSLTSKAATDVSKPIKDAFESSLSELKLA
ncbi:phasin [Aquamicrobium zhengzhouense]|uniref:Phasin n=1 Tax=Aquamicrobium zhengzhouense TaxID=2781738 RepID=A0ABS0SCY8_9HYPH|nr:phasin [Aquamicrobium zhengzhouense]MBI1621106.1 phasin [Aquamicrobium zhengzhouense]